MFFRPDLRDDTFDVQSLPFNFTIRDTAIRGSATTTLRAQSVASYEVEGRCVVVIHINLGFLHVFLHVVKVTKSLAMLVSVKNSNFIVCPCLYYIVTKNYFASLTNTCTLYRLTQYLFLWASSIYYGV